MGVGGSERDDLQDTYMYKYVGAEMLRNEYVHQCIHTKMFLNEVTFDFLDSYYLKSFRDYRLTH